MNPLAGLFHSALGFANRMPDIRPGFSDRADDSVFRTSLRVDQQIVQRAAG